MEKDSRDKKEMWARLNERNCSFAKMKEQKKRKSFIFLKICLF